jgi:YVTN family beta-propeller protein
VGLENDDALVTIDTASNRVIAKTPIGQAPQALAYVANAVPTGDGLQGLQPLGVASQVTHLTLVPTALNKLVPADQAPTSVALFDQGLIQVVEAAATSLEPGQSYVLALAESPDGNGPLQPLATFVANPAGSAIVNAIGLIRQVVEGTADERRRYLVIAPQTNGKTGLPVQVQKL